MFTRYEKLARAFALLLGLIVLLLDLYYWRP